jgi:hypothetical protein
VSCLPLESLLVSVSGLAVLLTCPWPPIIIPSSLSLIYHHFVPVVLFTCVNQFSFAPLLLFLCLYFWSPVRFTCSLSFPSQAATRYQFLRHTHSDEPPVSHPCTEPGTGYHLAHTLKRSLRDRQLAYTCHTPPPLLLTIATVQNQKSHIPLRRLPPTQRLTRPLGHLSKESPSFSHLINSFTTSFRSSHLQPHLQQYLA